MAIAGSAGDTIKSKLTSPEDHWMRAAHPCLLVKGPVLTSVLRAGKLRCCRRIEIIRSRRFIHTTKSVTVSRLSNYDAWRVPSGLAWSTAAGKCSASSLDTASRGIPK